MRMTHTAICAVALLALATTGCAKLMAQSEDGSTAGTGPGMSGSADGSGGSGGGGGGLAGQGGGGMMRAGRSGGGMAERVPVKEFHPAHEMSDVHFDFDRYDIRPDAARTLAANARLLRARGESAVLVEGHCDERGTSEFNLALGERRARAAMNALVSQGVDARRITIVSYGEDRPACRDHSEACWAQNRRARFLVRDR